MGTGADPLDAAACSCRASRDRRDTRCVIGSIAAPRPHSARTVLIDGHCDAQPPGPGGVAGRLTRTTSTCDPMQPPRRTPRRRRAPRSLPVGARPARRQAPHARHRRRDAGGRGRGTRALRARRDLGRRGAGERPPGRSSLQRPTPSTKCTPRKSATTSESIATGHYDRPNQTNNELTFPSVFKRGSMFAHTRSTRSELADRARDRNRDPRRRAAPKVDHPERPKLPSRRTGRPRCRRCGDHRRGAARTESRRPPPLIRPDIEAQVDHCSALEQSGRGAGLGDQMTARVRNARVSEAGPLRSADPASPRTGAPRSALPRVAERTSSRLGGLASVHGDRDTSTSCNPVRPVRPGDRVPMLSALACTSATIYDCRLHAPEHRFTERR